MRKHPILKGGSPFKLIMKLVALAVVSLSLSTQSRAISFSVLDDDIQINLDTTISFGAAYRLDDPDPELFGLSNGGRQFSVNADDGNLNYEGQDFFSIAAKAVSELKIQYREYGGIFGRVKAFYDFENEERDRERTALTDEALDQVGSSIDLLDLYGYLNLDVAGVPIDLRVGQFVLSWGESTFIPNGINVINPVDVSALRVPGSEIRDALLPVPLVALSVGITPTISVEGFYQVRWEETEIDPPGTYYSTNDFVGPGGKKVLLGFGSVPDSTPLGFGAVVPRGETRFADDSGQWGVATRVLLPILNEIEIGLYYLNYHSRTPIISAQTGSIAGALSGDFAGSSRYIVEYPEDIQLFGLSFNTEFGGGIALQGEVSYRRDQPLQVDDVELLFTSLSAPASLGDPTSTFLGANSQLGFAGFDEYVSGYQKFDVWQFQSTITKVFGPLFGADQWVVLAEGAITYVPDLPSKDELRFEGAGTYTSANPIFTAAGAQPFTESPENFADDISGGYRFVVRFDYNNLFWGVNVSPLLQFGQDFNNTPSPIGNFVDGRKALSTGFNFSFQNSWTASLRYTNFFGGGRNNLIGDRDFISTSIAYSF